MDDVDELLSVIENPTRRRILELISKEPSYPLQLSKDIGVSVQAVTKNLVVMEQSGFVQRTEVKSDMGPNRSLYSPSTEFTLVVDMRSQMFSAKLYGPVDADVSGECDMRARLEEIDRRIEELDRERSRLLSERSAIASAMGGPREMDEEEPETETMGGR